MWDPQYWGEADRKPIEHLINALHNRGRTTRGIYQNHSLAPGMAHLVTIDLSSARHQPMRLIEKAI